MGRKKSYDNLCVIKILILLTLLITGCEKWYLEGRSIIIGDINSLDSYHDYVENIVFPSADHWNSFSIDVNKDNEYDIEFTFICDGGNFYGYHGTYIGHINPNFSFLLDSLGIKVCNEGDVVNFKDNFNVLGNDYETFLLSYFYYWEQPYQDDSSNWKIRRGSYYEGIWHEVENKFISFKFIDDNGSSIGWIRLGFNDEGKLEIYEYGYKRIKDR